MIQTAQGSAFTVSTELGYTSLSDLVFPDGVTDAAPFILATLTAGNTLYIPQGTFICSPMTWPAGASVFGAGAKSILQLKATSNLPLITLGSTSELSNFRVDGNKLNQTISGSHGIQILNAVSTSLRGISALNCRGDGINISGAASYGIQLSDCVSSGNTVNGIKVEQGQAISLAGCLALNSDLSATGDGIAIASAGSTVDKVTITSCTSRNNIGRGISILGFGARNVLGVTLDNCIVANNNNHGIHLVNAESCVINGGSVTGCLQDGIRLEGDVQYCRVIGTVVRTNTVWGTREVTSGITPNNNGIIYTLARGNGSDVITKVGAASFII